MRIVLERNRRYWVTSDLHLGHKNIIDYSDRPFDSVEEMNTQMVELWNERVGPEDIVFNLGDFSFKSVNATLDVLNRLNGRQHFVYGNHDRIMMQTKIQESEKILGFYDRLDVSYGDHYIVMHHYAQRVWDKHHRGSLHMYGHSHGSLPGVGRSVDVGVDSNELATGYGPMLLDDVIELLKHKPILKVDHH